MGGSNWAVQVQDLRADWSQLHPSLLLVKTAWAGSRPGPAHQEGTCFKNLLVKQEVKFPSLYESTFIFLEFNYNAMSRV